MENYQLLEEVGNGSYSIVYRAQDIRTGQIVAVKVMKFYYSKASKLQDNQLAALQLFHTNPCIIRLREHFIEQDVMVLVFELAGPTLLQCYQQLKLEQRRMPERDVRLVSYQVAVALGEVHSTRFMHRDLKPQNVLLQSLPTGELAVKLVDFGMCRRRAEKLDETLTGYVTTRWYRAPEVILSLPYDMKLDVFSLGAVMLELYLGYEAFPGADAIDQLNRIFSVTGTPTKEEWPEGMGLLEEKKIQFPQYKRLDLKVHLPEAMPQAIDLMQRMIECNPKQRISVVEMLQHPYFANINEGLPEQVKIVANKIVSMATMNEATRAKLQASHKAAEKYCRVVSKEQENQPQLLPEHSNEQPQIFVEKYMDNSKQDSTGSSPGTARKKKIDLSTTNKLLRTKSKKQEPEETLAELNELNIN